MMRKGKMYIFFPFSTTVDFNLYHKFVYQPK